jgi:HemY protein
LLHTLGRLCEQQRLWGKSQSYFEAALSVRETAETHLALAQLLERLDRTDAAQPHYRAAALLSHTQQPK